MNKTAKLLEFCDKDFEHLEEETERFLAEKRAENERLTEEAKQRGIKSIPLAELLDHQNGTL